MGDETEAATPYSAGDKIGGKYRLVRSVGGGAMGAVWQATQPELSLDVAIKILHQRHQNSDVVDRLMREAQVAAQLQHPGLVRAFDFGTTTLGDPYIVLEWLDGENLGEILESKGALSPVMAVRTFLSLVSAVRALHESGVIHRDIKPDNILLVRESANCLRAKLVDFGIAKTDEADGDYVPEQNEEGILGTPGYLAPEQVLGEDVEGYTDVWSLCVTLVEAMSGEPLIGGDGVMSVMMLKAQGAMPDLVQRYPDLPADLLRIAERGLAVVGEERLTIGELQQALATWLHARGIADDVSGVSVAHYLSFAPDDEACRLVPLHAMSEHGSERIDVVVDLQDFESVSSRGQTLLSSELEVDGDMRDSSGEIVRPRRRLGGWFAAAAAAVLLGLLTQGPVRASIAEAAGTVAINARGVMSYATEQAHAASVTDQSTPSSEKVVSLDNGSIPVAFESPTAVDDVDVLPPPETTGVTPQPSPRKSVAPSPEMPMSNLEIHIQEQRSPAPNMYESDEETQPVNRSIYDESSPADSSASDSSALGDSYHPDDI